MGTSLELRVEATSDEAARGAETRALAEIDRLARVFSNYDPTSEFRRWQATSGEPVAISAELMAMFKSCDAWRDRSGGAFDPRAGAIVRAWSLASKQNRVPTEAEVAEARALMAGPAWRLDEAAGTAAHLSACPLTLDGIAKGLIVGRAVAAGRGGPDSGVTGVLLNVGGDLRAEGAISRRIGIAPPRGDSETAPPITRIEVRDRSVATSGDSQRGFVVAGRRYSHIFDPRTALPASSAIAATVIAPDAVDADVLAKVLNIVPIADAPAIARATPGAEFLIVAPDGSTTRSDGFARFERSRVVLASRAAAPVPDDAKPAIAADSELVISFEIRPTEGDARRYRRPYVAAWVEDKDGLPVRTLALWLQTKAPGPRWHPDLKRWYKDDQVRKLADAGEADLIETIARPTRPPGKYDVAWDGKDDAGKPVPAGEYTLFLEAAREHGTYQIIRKPLALPAADSFAEDLPGNAEFKSAAVRYHRKGEGR